ncbi:YncE family protein [Mycobacterium spongiae]|uniref:YncE family protein n=1 Tax=Mycobacterium spongiae TaxID=886343 RepID=A0A975JZM9_9MYCO|nr:YncE family protein [Mycobacterium spongiae]QUR68664.1 YncE family protein [Mycobacterium spongiae]
MSDVNDQRAARGGRDVRDVEVFEFGSAPVLPVEIEIPLNSGPISGIGISPDGSRVMVTNYRSDSLSIIDTDTGRVVDTIADVAEPFAIAMGGLETNRAYVSTVSMAYDSIAVVDTCTNAVIDSHPLALSVSDLAVSPDGKYVYASRNGARCADVAVLDTTTERVEVVEIATSPGTTTECVTISPDGGRLYVGTNGPSGGQLVVVATRAQSEKDAGRGGRSRKRRKGSKSSGATGEQPGLRVAATIEIGSPVRDVALSPDGDIAYVASCGPDFAATVDIIDTRTNTITSTRKIGETGGLLTRLTLSDDGDRAYLVSGDRVTVLCTLTHDVIGTVTGKSPSCVVESPDGKHLYIGDYSGTVTLTRVASTLDSVGDLAEDASDTSADWVMPELLEREPALA